MTHEIEIPEMMDVLSSVVEQAQDYAAKSKAQNTLRAYRADWRNFDGWCCHHGLQCLPATPETVALYLSALATAGRRPSTIQRRLSAIAQAHRFAGHSSPTHDERVRQIYAGIRRQHGTVQQGKSPVLTAELRRMVATLPGTLCGIRDRALLLVGFAGAFRRSELVALDVHDVTHTGDGLVVTIRRSKTDQEGEGRKVGLPYGSNPLTCPVRAYQAWIEVSTIADGPIFRPIDRHGNMSQSRLSDKAVALIVKRAAAAAGLDPKLYAGHSLRSGLATAAAQAGVSERSIMDQTGHKSLTVLRRYIREGSLFRENAAASIGL